MSVLFKKLYICNIFVFVSMFINKLLNKEILSRILNKQTNKTNETNETNPHGSCSYDALPFRLLFLH